MSTQAIARPYELDREVERLARLRWADVESRLAAACARYGPTLLRAALGTVFVWFGALKLIGASPAADLVARTVTFVPAELFLPVLGIWEIAIGVGFLVRQLLRSSLLLLFLHMPGTMLPLVVLPEACFAAFPHALTMEGQYIVKNLVLIAAAMVVAGAELGRRR